MHHEELAACPLCRASVRAVWHPALVDDTFRAVPGSWTLWRCLACGCAYLDPRPDRKSIGEAYRGYYTHATAAPGRPLSWVGRAREWMEHCYLGRRYGVPGPSRSRLGHWLYAAMLPFKHMSDVSYRHLPGPGRGRTLLDVGCGNGGFLVKALACGWRAEGVDPDPLAAAEATRSGLQVRAGGLELYAGQSGCFDVITLSHVIEHVHDPAAMLADCHRLLKPGGRLWIATPNTASYGHAHFGCHWRGLEAPRHLVLFDEPVLLQALGRAGFRRTHRLPSQLREHLVLARASHAMAQGLPLERAPSRLPPGLAWRVWLMAVRAWLRPTRREFLYIEAFR